MFDRKEYEGKRALRRWPKWLTALMAVVLVAAMTVGGTLAWLSTHTNALTNTFVMGTVTPDIDEDFDKTTKSNITVTNTGTVEAYVRVALVFSWREGGEAGQYDGTQPGGNIIAGTPQEGIDYTFTAGSNKWVLGNDGYYYYTEPVAPQSGKTESLCTIAVQNTEMSQKYHLDVQVLADSIQSKPTNVVSDMWTAVTGVDDDGNLTIQTN